MEQKKIEEYEWEVDAEDFQKMARKDKLQLILDSADHIMRLQLEIEACLESIKCNIRIIEWLRKLEIYNFEHCPHCGAKMDEENK